jgi:hypothetical protein
VLQEFAKMSPVVPLVFCAYLFLKAWLDHRMQIRSLPTAPPTEPGPSARGADVTQMAPPSAGVDEDTAS